jgi:hypothetical protein
MDITSVLLDLAGIVIRVIGTLLLVGWILGVALTIVEEIQVGLLVRRGDLSRCSLPDPAPSVLCAWHATAAVYRARGAGGREILVVRGARSNRADGTDEFDDPFYPSFEIAIARLTRPVTPFHLRGCGHKIDRWDLVAPGRDFVRLLPPGRSGGLLADDGWMAYYTESGRPDRVAQEADLLFDAIERYALGPAPREPVAERR